MSLVNFKPQFDNAYQEIFQKVLVALKVANLRFEPVLKQGESVERVSYDISNVRVRTTSLTGASTIDPITDSSELLLVNISKEAVFFIHDDEVKQAGSMNPGENIGGQVAIKVAIDFDARIFAQILNATQKFDTGDLTTLVSTGVPFAESATNVPIFAAMAPAKLRRYNQTLSNLCLVTDSYGVGLMTQYLLSKNIDLVSSVYANGYAGDVSNAQVYVSENLTATASFNMATTPTDGDTVTIAGPAGSVTFTFKTVLGVTAGNVLIGGSADAARANLAALINTPGTTTAQGVALSAANQVLVTDDFKLAATNNDTTNVMTIVATGSGALTVSETLTDVTDAWSKNCIHGYFGKKGAIDAVLQDMKEVDMRITVDRRGTNVFTSYLGGIKLFADGAKKFLDVLFAR
jgi:hypothetical protein